MVCKFAVDIFTIKLAELLAPDAQVALIAVEVSPVRAEPTAREVPDVWPEVAAHSTLYGTLSNPLDRVNALLEPLPLAVTL
jgi:hypothetical protein